MDITLDKDEELVKEGAANLQKGIEVVGGKLYLTNRRILFIAHALNIQGGLTEVPLADIKSIDYGWTMFLGFIPIWPNCLSLSTGKGEKYSFVLFGRKVWAKKIGSLISA